MQIRQKHITLAIAFLFIMAFTIATVRAQQTQISFGKNRVQYKDFDWQFYETDNFRIYFYQGGQDMGKYAILSAEKCLSEMNALLDYKLSSKLDLIVYNDISDMHQTNIGIKEDVEKVTGTIQLKNNKLFVYFNGEHSDMDRQIKEGITQLYLANLVKGRGFQEVVQNSLLLNLPSWFTEGLVKYAGTPWSTDLEDQLRDGIVSGRLSNLTKLSSNEMRLVGHSIWNYVEQKYGKDAVSNLLYLTRVNRSVDDGILFVTGMPIDAFLKQWFFWNFEKFKAEQEKFDVLDDNEKVSLKKHKDYVKYQVKLSPDGRYLAYAINELARWKVMVYNFEDESTRTIVKGGFRTTSLETDLSNPMIAWEPKGKKLSVVFEKKDQFFLSHYDAEEFKRESKPEPMKKFQKVYDFSYAEDSRNIVLSAMQKSQIDIYKYYIPTNKVIQLTDDYYDDLQATYIEIGGRQGVLFVSNRPNDDLVEGRLDTILPNGTFDVFFRDLNNSVQALSQISFTPLANESFPQAFSASSYTFLSDYTGIRSQYTGEMQILKVDDRVKYVFTVNERLGDLDSIILDQGIVLDSVMASGETVKEILEQYLVPVNKVRGVNTSYKKYNENIDEISVALLRGEQAELFDGFDGAKIFHKNLEYNFTQSSDTSLFMKKKVSTWKEEQIEIEDKKRIAAQEEIYPDEKKKKVVVYQSKFDGWEELSPAHKEALLPIESIRSEETSNAYKFARTRQYFLKFMTDNFSLGVDNSLLVTNYQPFNPGNPTFNQPGFNPMLRFGITDLFEDHKLYGGIRMPLFSNLNPQVNGQNLPFKIGLLENMELFVTYENYKKRWDKSFTFYHKNLNEITGIFYPSINVNTVGILNTKTNLVETKITYPFNQLNSLRIKFGFRNDRFIIKSTDIFNLNAANSSQNWVYNRVEFVHDHTLKVAKNIQYGFKANVYAEFQKEFPTREDTILKQSVQVPIFNNSYFMLWGVDARHYQKVYKTIIWANRFAYSTSVGTKKMVYYLGGTDGMLFPKFNENTIVNTQNNYAYQSLAVNMHGFQQNIRNGNSFAVINSELRVPIFSAFRKREMKSSLLENFQLVGFFDIGTAWEGVSPFGKGNIAQEVRQNATQNPTALARVDVYRKPVVMGFGTGFRMEIMGYFIRADVGWGYDTGKVNKPRFQFALGYDF